MSELVNTAEAYVFDLFKEKLSTAHVFHDFKHTLEVKECCETIGKAEELTEDALENLVLAALFHDVGYIQSYQGHEKESIKAARTFFVNHQLPTERVEQICALINSTQPDVVPGNIMEEILHDADLSHIGKDSFFEKAELLRLEWETFLGDYYNPLEWEALQLNFLTKTNFMTAYALKTYGAQRDTNILEQQKKLKKVEEKISKDKAKSKKPGRGIETMYRATYRNHINLSSIADNKANMMISINTIILSVIITIVGSGFTFTGKEFVESLRFTVPMGVLLISALISVIFAILSARPTITEKKVSQERLEKKQSSVLFFGNFVNISLPEFITSLRMLKEDETMLYDNMAIDLYHLGLVLKKKYILLRYSYNIFMIGITLCVISFIFIFSYTSKTV